MVDSLLVTSASGGDLLLLKRQASQRPNNLLRLQSVSISLTYLRLLPLRKKLILPLLILRFVSCKVAFLSNLIHQLLVNPLQVHLRTRSDDISGIDSS